MVNRYAFGCCEAAGHRAVSCMIDSLSHEWHDKKCQNRIILPYHFQESSQAFLILLGVSPKVFLKALRKEPMLL